MNTNAYYEIGSSHRNCEDYALSGIYSDMAYAIVSDGCSSSEHSDVGARLLSHITKGVLIHLKDRGVINTPEYSSIFRELVLRKSIEVKNSLGLPTDAFDATLLISTVLDDKIVNIAWGDGYVIYKTKDGKLITYGINFSTGAPYYLSYEMSPSKKQAYLDEYGSGNITTTNTIINSEGVVEFEHKVLNSTCMMQSLYKEADAPSMGFVTVSSDGLGTYQDDPKNVEEKKSYKDSDIIPLVMAYKNITGEFVTRRMQRLKYDLEKKLIVHLDDVSCSSIAIS
jgi:hypothetical protein